MSKGLLSKGEPLAERQVIFLCEGICERVFYDAAIDKLFKDSPIKMRSKNVSGACRFENKAVSYIKEILSNGNCSLLVLVCHDTDVSESGSYPKARFDKVIERLNKLGPSCRAYDLPAKGCLENFFLEDEEALSKALKKNVKVNRLGGAEELKKIFRSAGKYYTKTPEAINSILKHFNFEKWADKHFSNLKEKIAQFCKSK